MKIKNHPLFNRCLRTFFPAISWAAAIAACHSLQALNNPADMTGPDGILYPDWRTAGVPNGIPTNLVVRTSITDFGAVPNQNMDSAPALEQAAAYAASQGGGVVTIPAGTFYLDRPVMITNSNVVLRGAGSNATKFYFRYYPPTHGVAFFTPTANNATIGKNTWVEIHADPVNLTSLKLTCGSAEIVSTTGFNLTTLGTYCITAFGTGSKTLVAKATYTDGSTQTQTLNVTLVGGTDPNPYSGPLQLGAINFYGIGDGYYQGPYYLLASDGVRGDTTLTLSSGHNIAVNDMIQLTAPTTARWKTEIQTDCSDTKMRKYLFTVTKVNGNVITLNQPLRIDYPVVDGSYVEKFYPISGCGVEDFSIEQTNALHISSITFSAASNSWATGMRVTKTGYNPLYFLASKWCEIRNCLFDDQWSSSAYVGWERSYDCLMDTVTTYGLRHAPLFQWSAAGNVIRNGIFYDSDAQWHAGWATENLIENCIIESDEGCGGYGYGMYATPPDDSGHGPIGPRNVVYNCDVTSPYSGVWMGGQNRGWIFRYNRFATDSGYGIYAQMSSSDHIIRDNVFAMRNGIHGAYLTDGTCANIQLIGNKFYGVATNSDIVGGTPGNTVLQNNLTSDYLTPVAFSNPGFENSLTDWVTSGTNGMCTTPTNAVHNGTYGLRITDNSTTLNCLLISPPLLVTAGKGYIVRFWAKTLSSTATDAIGFYLYYYDSTGTKISSLKKSINLTSNWDKYYIQQVAPPNATKAKIHIITSTTNQITIDLDDFEFGSIPFDIPNSEFEYGLTSWDNTGDNGMSTASASAARTGTGGLRVTDASSTLQSKLTTQKFPVTAGNTYQVRFWSRILSGTGASVDMIFYNASNGIVSQSTQSIPTFTTDWRQYVLRADAPSGAATMAIQIHSDPAQTVTADFDIFVLSEVPPRLVPIQGTESIFDWEHLPLLKRRQYY